MLQKQGSLIRSYSVKMHFNMKKSDVNVLISVLTTMIGVTLMVYMIIVEREPGAIPLLLIVLGIGWYFVTRDGVRSHPEKSQ